MKLRRWAVAGGVMLAAVAVLASPAGAETGARLRTGDVVCTDQSRSQTGVFFNGTINDGTALFTVHTATSVGGPEELLWDRTVTDGSVNEIVNSPEPGLFLRGCVRIIRARANTSFLLTFFVLGPDAEHGFGPHTATLSSGAQACGDSVAGRARLTGRADQTVTWSLNGRDTEFNTREIFLLRAARIDQVFTPPPDITFQTFCVNNTSRSRATISFEMVPA